MAGAEADADAHLLHCAEAASDEETLV